MASNPIQTLQFCVHCFHVPFFFLITPFQSFRCLCIHYSDTISFRNSFSQIAVCRPLSHLSNSHVFSPSVRWKCIHPVISYISFSHSSVRPPHSHFNFIIGRNYHKYHFCCDKNIVATSILLSRQKTCYGPDKHVFVATEMIIVAAATNDSFPPRQVKGAISLPAVKTRQFCPTGTSNFNRSVTH